MQGYGGHRCEYSCKTLNNLNAFCTLKKLDIAVAASIFALNPGADATVKLRYFLFKGVDMSMFKELWNLFIITKNNVAS